MKFGILGAMPHEVAFMERSMTVRRSVEAGMRTFFEGTWAGQEVVLVLSRVGKVSASITTLLLLERFGVTHIVFTGVAGAVDPGLRIGDVVVAERLVQHDMDASPLPAFQRFEIPLLGKIFFEAGLCDEASQAAIRYTQGDFLRDVAAEKRAASGWIDRGYAGVSWPAATSSLPIPERTRSFVKPCPVCFAQKWRVPPSRRFATRWVAFRAPSSVLSPIRRIIPRRWIFSGSLTMWRNILPVASCSRS